MDGCVENIIVTVAHYEASLNVFRDKVCFSRKGEKKEKKVIVTVTVIEAMTAIIKKMYSIVLFSTVKLGMSFLCKFLALFLPFFGWCA